MPRLCRQSQTTGGATGQYRDAGVSGSLFESLLEGYKHNSTLCTTSVRETSDVRPPVLNGQKKKKQHFATTKPVTRPPVLRPYPRGKHGGLLDQLHCTNAVRALQRG